MFDFKTGRRKLKDSGRVRTGTYNLTKKLDYNTLYDDVGGHE